MVITGVQLTNFRSYIDADFELSPDVTIVVGPNASGKTNLLEGLLVACLGRSYRADAVQLINQNSDQARLQIDTDKQERTIVIERADERASRQLIVNGATKSRWRHEDNLPVVLFEPEDMLMIGGSPSLRRAYLDGLLEATIGGYAAVRKRFQRCLTQRNNLLKHGRANDDQLFVWDMQMAEYATELVTRRRQLVEQLNEKLTDTYSTIAGRTAELRVVYEQAVPATNYQSSLLAALHKRWSLDRERGFTSVGPHRDDLLIELNDHTARSTASRGEARSIVLSLKLAEVACLSESFQTAPLLLLDDVFSELDQARQKALSKALKGHQTILTTTNADTWVQFKRNHFETIKLGVTGGP